ncbi:MFS transporter [Galbitalea sp. SE-J8]|uniref:MFS transporter n=1 Tax=Galbitalea sp. SE-J8 TaxID=3054952 RepID=UPI00259CE622|nr:MFS transporter [Galbitalea sp. SE-J8]MDM4763875.1 MFS transporter [Galbitalea sp. SE-J8]
MKDKTDVACYCALVMASPHSSDRSTAAVAQGAIVASGFALVLAGTNAINPLLPVYRDTLGLSALVMSLTFVAYVGTLVVVLLLMARPRFTRHAPVLFGAGLAVAVASDALLSLASEPAVLVGRAVAGLGGGIATGAASALVVAAIGDPGRGVSATGNLVGAVIGSGGAQAIVSLAPAVAPYLVFLIHGALLVVVLVASVSALLVRRAPNADALRPVTSAAEPLALRRRDIALFASGCIGWVAVSLALVDNATVFVDLGLPAARALASTVMLVASAAAQLASPVLARRLPWASGLGALALGIVVAGLGAIARIEPVVIAGFAIVGVGIGVSYRTALVVLTRGSSPARQGALASLYAAVTYGAAATSVLVVGAIADEAGLVPTLVAAAGVVAALAVVACIRAPRLRDTIASADVAARVRTSRADPVVTGPARRPARRRRWRTSPSTPARSRG